MKGAFENAVEHVMNMYKGQGDKVPHLLELSWDQLSAWRFGRFTPAARDSGIETQTSSL
jgi:hypothetical protein